MFPRILSSTPRPLLLLTTALNNFPVTPLLLQPQFPPPPLPTTSTFSLSTLTPPKKPLLLRTIMASGGSGETFPAQKQETQPGKEHVMDPTPTATHPDYKPSNKLRVRS